jgi:surface polysaccharide O-acyltransferase-like enzyme
MTANKRIDAYDLLKTIAIFLVVFYHVGKLNVDFLKSASPILYFNYFLYSLSSMGVPLFFMVNGALLLNRPDYNFKKHMLRSVTILLLLFAWGCISLIVLGWMYQETYTLAEFIKALVTLKSGRINQLWFLKALFFVYVFSPFLKALYDQNRTYAFYMLLVLFVFTFSHLPYLYWINPFYGHYSYAIVYFLLGGFAAQYAHHDTVKKAYPYLLLFTSASLLFLYGVYCTLKTGLIYDTVWEGYDTVMTLGMALAFFVWCTRVEIPGAMLRFIRLVGSCTLGIYFIHLLVHHFIARSYPLENTNLLISVSYSLLVLMMALAITWLAKKIPFIKRLFTL